MKQLRSDDACKIKFSPTYPAIIMCRCGNMFSGCSIAQSPPPPGESQAPTYTIGRLISYSSWCSAECSVSKLRTCSATKQLTIFGIRGSRSYDNLNHHW